METQALEEKKEIRNPGEKLLKEYCSFISVQETNKLSPDRLWKFLINC